MATLGNLDTAFKEARRIYALSLIAADASPESSREGMYYNASLIKRRIIAAENSLKHGRSMIAMSFLEGI
jgi:hypothetical protein